MITGLDKAIAQIEHIKKELPFVMANLMKEVAKYGQERALMYLGPHYYTGATYASVDYEYTPTSATVRAGGAAIWIEFGTGITRDFYGAGPLPPGIVPHGQYDKGKGANPNGWYFKTDDINLAVTDENGEPWTTADGEFIAHTMGIDSTPFMTLALRDMVKFLEERGAKVIMRGIK